MITNEFSFIAQAVEKYLSMPEHMCEAVDVATGHHLDWTDVAKEYEGEERRLLESINKGYGVYVPMGFANQLAQRIADRIIHLRKWRSGFEECNGAEVAGMMQRLQIADNWENLTDDWAISVDCGDGRTALIMWDSDRKLWLVQTERPEDKVEAGHLPLYSCWVRFAGLVKWFILQKQSKPNSKGCWLVCG